MRLASYIAALALGCVVLFSCGMSPANTGERAGPKGKEELITVFITGNELGTMKPCGCSGGQLGGLIKRGEVLRLAQKARRVIIDTGGLVDGEEDVLVEDFRPFPHPNTSLFF